MENKMKRSYMLSRIIMPVIAFIIFKIMFINEDDSWRIVPYIFAVVTLAFSFPSTLISRKLINIGSSIKSKALKVLYYVLGLPLVSAFIFGVICFIVFFIYNGAPTPNEIGPALGQALMFLFLVAVIFIGIVLPYIQTIIVLLLNRFIKTDNID